MKKGSHQTEESKRRMSESHRGYKTSEETKIKLSVAHRGKTYNTPKRIIDKGYVRLYKPNHPMSDSSGYLLEHRYVMSEYLGRNLGAEEIVHHKDQNKSNNDIDNLKITNRQEHIGIHFDPIAHGNKIKEVRKNKFWRSVEKGSKLKID